jgi:hypothetical protein
MPPPRLGDLNGASKSTRESTILTDPEPESDADDVSSPDLNAKDVTEEELEKLVFGDDAGFRSALRSHGSRNQEVVLARDDDAEDGSAASEGESLEGVADADVGRGPVFVID